MQQIKLRLSFQQEISNYLTPEMLGLCQKFYCSLGGAGFAGGFASLDGIFGTKTGLGCDPLASVIR